MKLGIKTIRKGTPQRVPVHGERSSQIVFDRSSFCDFLEQGFPVVQGVVHNDY